MRILYAIQATGNGHISRATELIPHLRERAHVDLLVSGITAELKLPFQHKYKFHGASYFFGTRGGVNYVKSFRHFKPFRLLKDIRNCPVKEYDFIISDFEPIGAWAGRRQGVPVIGVSHQAAFFSSQVPMPKRRRRLFEFGMRHIVAPVNAYVGLHYQAYDNNVVQPIIRQSLQNQTIDDQGHICVYLPAFSDELLISHFQKVKGVEWQVFSKKTTEVYSKGNVTVNPINKDKYNQSLLNCKALLIGGGFQGTSEGLYLKKKMMVIPMFDQYEQKCNAAALRELGVKVVERVTKNFNDVLTMWLEDSTMPQVEIIPSNKILAPKIIEMAKSYL